ncbi:hypothetical protein, conserved [Babesia ovata]|uniref:C3H1-type domain-containing protein n=1 Tax=Babesia ovata TaxID=189622 RepID=A0A2H6KKL4_9APIC|nr:uncharacterized protein BOVATA_050230 [Babesia ovata]GBE63530.1 hypothetical protein, conserved [Babesia ovata]
MSFLHGVLQTVKDDESVKTYDKDDLKITKVISDLHNSVGKGRQAFQAAVHKVGNKTGEVTAELGKYYEKISLLDNQPLQVQLQEWSIVLGRIAADLINITNNNLTDLDSTLASQIAHEIKPIQKSVEVLLGAAREGELEKQVQTVDKTLERTKNEIKRDIKERFSKIDESVKDLGKIRGHCFKKICDKLKDAKIFMDNDFNREYANEVKGYFDMVKEAVNNVHTTLSKNKGDLGELVTQARANFVAIKNDVGTTDAALGDTIYGGWQYLRIHIQGLVGDLNGTDLMHRGPPKSGVLRDIVDGVLKYVKGFGEKTTQDDSFENTVDEWIKEILRENEYVGEKVKAYVENNKALRGEYKVEDAKSFSETAIVKIAKHIAGKLESENVIGEAVQEVQERIKAANRDADKIKGYIEAAQFVCSEFIGGVEEVIQNGRIGSVSFDQIAGEIEGQLGVSNSGLKKYDLQEAIKRIMMMLSTTASQVANELHRLVTKSELGTKLKQAIEKVAEISMQFNGVKDDGARPHDYGDNIQTVLDRVVQNIDPLGILLGKTLNTDGSIQGKFKEIEGDLKRLDNLKKGKEQEGSVEYYKDKAEENMRELKREIQSKLEAIEHDVNNANVDLHNAIKALLETLEESQEACLTSVTSAFATLTAEVRALFAQGHKADLAALKKLVEEQKGEIEKIIEKDKSNGVKGLLKRVYGGEFPSSEVPPPATPQPDTLLTKLNEALSQKADGQKVRDLANKFEDYIDGILQYAEYQVSSPSEDPRKRNPTDQSERVRALKGALDTLLTYLRNNSTRDFCFDHISTSYLDALNASLHKLSPAHFHGFHNPLLLDALRSGMDKFTEQLSHAYVNTYSGRIPTEKWVIDKVNSDKTPPEQVLSTEGRNCAKVCLTILEGLRSDLWKLRIECDQSKSPNGTQINRYKHTSFGKWFHERGYTVNSTEGKQTGELQDKKEMNGEKIKSDLLEKKIENADKVESLKQWKDEQNKNSKSKQTNGDITLIDIVDFLRDFSRTCYRFGHYYIPSSPKSPSNIYNMLCWLAGLKYNHMFDRIDEHFKELFDKPDAEKDKAYKNIDHTELSLDATSPVTPTATSKITPKDLTDTLGQVCLFSRNVLIAFLGNGHAEGRYAVDFSCNSDNLLYPTNASACFDMLVDILNRVFCQLRFLCSQCQNGPTLGGWADCWYGRGVGGSAWLCNDRQCPNQQGDPMATQNSNQKHTQKCDQNCNQSVKCGLKSPLQSFLEDGLPGFLPHSITSPGCKLTCSLSNHRGIPCKTPMGFNDISQVASHTKRASHLKDALSYFCGPGSNFKKLCSYLSCLLRRPPQTLDDMLAFYYQFLKHWDNRNVRQHKSVAFDDAVKKANFGDTNTQLNIASIQSSSAHSEKHSKGDLFSLTDCNHQTNWGLPCGKYLHPLTLDIRSIFSENRAGNYLSWVVYCTETFVCLLYDLYASCKKCETPGSRCCDKSCIKTCTVKYTNDQGDAVIPKAGTNHDAECHSIVKCPDTHPTLYKYGFTFTSPDGLSGEGNGGKYKRTCKDFCEALKKVLDKDSVLIQLINDIDEFIWKIREKFSITLVALWSLSLLYLLHIAVVRLDVLRIRSHLRSPSSHRIAAQSLLAAARVRALANVKYFSP